MITRASALRRLGEGDLFNVEDEAGPTRICVVLSVTETTIVARSTTVQEIIEFDRKSGTARPPFGFVVTSIAELPQDIHDIFLGLDRKYREGKIRRAKDPTWIRPPGDLALTDDQKRAFLFAHDFYEQNPLPPT
jgi:hypothetical protein